MARNLLTALEIKSSNKAKLRDGEGLWLHKTPAGNRVWVFIFVRHGRRREMGLGAYGSGTGQVSITSARAKADEIRAILGRGGDPFKEMDERKSKIEVVTFGKLADDYIDVMKSKWKGAKTEAGWKNTLTVHAKAIRKMPVTEVTTEDVVRILKPIWREKAETAGKVRERVKMVLDHAKARGLRSGDNPAEWKGHLDQILPPLEKLQRGHHAAMPYAGNFEDVLLSRIFRGVRDGFYVDIGAHHAKYSSASYVFHERGWSGVNVEPGHLFETFPQLRPRDINIQAVITETDGETEFFYHRDSPATSTVLAQMNPELQSRVSDRMVMRVPSIRMSTLVKKYIGDRHVNFLKVDAEGSEPAIFGSCDWTVFRPEVIVAEAVLPFTTTPVYQDWIHHLTSAGYTLTLFDGINVWLVRRESAHLIPLASLPVNQLDGFNAYDDEKTHLREEVDRLRVELDATRNANTRHFVDRLVTSARRRLSVARSLLTRFR